VRTGGEFELYEYAAESYIHTMTRASPLPSIAPVAAPGPPWLRQRTQAKARILVEALPYMGEHAGRIVVIKLGGSAMIGGLLDRFAEDVALLRLAGIRPIVVHGGGLQVTEALNRSGVRTIGLSEDGSHLLMAGYWLEVDGQDRSSALDAAGPQAGGAASAAVVIEPAPQPTSVASAKEAEPAKPPGAAPPAVKAGSPSKRAPAKAPPLKRDPTFGF
jgi:hypothetical protein